MAEYRFRDEISNYVSGDPFSVVTTLSGVVTVSTSRDLTQTEYSMLSSRLAMHQGRQSPRAIGEPAIRVVAETVQQDRELDLEVIESRFKRLLICLGQTTDIRGVPDFTELWQEVMGRDDEAQEGMGEEL